MSPSRSRNRIRRVAAGVVAVLLGSSALVVGTATAASAVSVDISIQATNATTQKSGSEFDYQINLSCLGTNAPSCDGAVVHIPLDDGIGMDGWVYGVSGGPAGFVQDWHVDTADHEIVVTLADTIRAGLSTSLLLAVTPPNRTTPDGTTWSLLPSVSSPDPDMDGTTAPTPAAGTATATVPLTVAKTSDRTFYRDGDIITYAITATCPASPPAGSIDAQTLTVTDTLPDGLEIVDPGDGTVSGQTITWSYADPDAVPAGCGGAAGSAAPDSHTVQVRVGSVGDAPGDDFTPNQKVTNTVTAQATPRGGGAPTITDASRDVFVLDDDGTPFPGNHSVGKSAAGPLDIGTGPNNGFTGTYPGRWLPNGDNSSRPASVLEAAPASYTIATHIDNDSFQYQLTDAVPCLDDLSGTVYGPSASVCAHPAFHVLGVTIAFTGTVPGDAYLPRYVDTDGVQRDMQPQSNAGTRVGWVIPQADIGRVAALVIPRDADQQDHHDDRVQVLGYADPSLARGDTLRNAVSADWYVGDAADPYDAAPQRATADLHILDDSQVGITKKMGDVGAVTGGQATLDLTATLIVPHAPEHDLVISDLLPAGTRLATDPAAITGTLSWKGQPTPSSTAPALQASVIPDYADGQELLKVVLPVTELPAEAGAFTLTIARLRVDKPSDPGVYTNTARVFYDDPDLLPACAAGQYSSLDPADSRDDPAASPANCSADATFRTATSASGQFELVKTVQGDYDSTPQAFPNVAHVKLQDGTAQYAIRWTNSGAPTLDGVVLYDVFPHVGDTGVSGAQASSQRGSQFAPVLRSIDAAPPGTSLAYSASANPCRPEVYPGQPAGCADDWTADPATIGGLAAVTAIRLTATAEYATGEGISLGFRASVPTVSADQIAWNSVAAFARTSSGTALLPSESPKVGITASDHRLAIAKAADVASAHPGDAVRYTVTVSNLGTAASDPTTAQDRLPAGLAFVSADQGGAYDAATGEVDWPVPAIPRGGHVDFTVTTRVDAVQTRSVITNAATVTTPPGYSPTVVDGACAADPNAACADLGVPVTPSRLPVTGVVAPVGAVLLALVAVGAGLVLRRRTARLR